MQTKNNLSQTQVLQVLQRYDGLSLAPEPAFDDLVALAAQICDTPMSAISLLDFDRQRFKATCGIEMRECAREDSFCAATIQQRDVLVVEDAMVDARFRHLPMVSGGPRVRFYAGAPLLAPNHQCVGTLSVIDQKPRRLGAKETSALQTLAQQVVQLFELRYAAQQLSQIRDSIDTERQLTEAVTGSALTAWQWDLATGLVNIISDGAGLLHDLGATTYDATRFLELLHQADLLEMRKRFFAALKDDVPYRMEHRLRTATGGWRWLLSRGKVTGRDPGGRALTLLGTSEDITTRKEIEARVLMDNALSDSMLNSLPGLLCILDAKGRIVRWNANLAQRTGFSDEELEGMHVGEFFGPSERQAAVQHINTAMSEGYARGEASMTGKDGVSRRVEFRVRQVEIDGQRHLLCTGVDVTRQRHEADSALYRATHDVPSALPKTGLLRDQLAQRIARREPLALMSIGLANFKAISHALGTGASEAYLQQLLQRLRTAMPRESFFARAGDDSLFVLVDDADQASRAEWLAQNLLQAMVEPFFVHGHPQQGNCSVGVSRYPHDALQADTLLSYAEIAKEHAARQGPNRYQLFGPQMAHYVEHRLRTESSLRQALARGEFELHYQPIARAQSGAVQSFEALLRWRLPDGSMRTPGQFLHIAEESGLIVPIGEWVLREACAQAAAWRRDGHAELRVAVNLSSMQVDGQSLPELVNRVLNDTKLPAANLELELVESSLLPNTLDSAQALRELGALGVHLSVDDFGTGYSSLAYLRRLPLDCIKIDRTFVADLTSGADGGDAIVRAIIDMAHRLGLCVVAEGVETPPQLDQLKRFGCDLFQGYLLSPAVPAAMASQLILR